MIFHGASRRRFHRRLCASAAAGALAVVVLAGLAPAAAPPEFAQRQVFFHCGPARVSNLDSANVPGWNGTAPSQPLGAGAGCVSADPASGNNASTGPRDDGVWQGQFTGNLKSFTVEAYVTSVGPGRQTGQISIRPLLTIDGATINVSPVSASVTVSPGPNAALDIVRLTISGLDLTEDLNQDGQPDPGPGTTVRTLRVRLSSWVVTTTLGAAWVFDATEAPSGIIFNPASPAATVFARA